MISSRSRQGSVAGGSGHPFFNDVVLNEVLKYSTVKDLNSHRLVCQKWYKASLPRWKSDITVQVYPLDSDRPQKDSAIHTRRYEGLSAKDLLILLDKEEKTKSGKTTNLQLAAKPFRNYCLNKWNFDTEPTSETIEFFTWVGPGMKSISFRDCDFPVYNIHNRDNILRLCKNLKNVFVHNYNPYDEQLYSFSSQPMLCSIFNGVGEIILLKQLGFMSNYYNTADHQRLQQISPNLLSDLEALEIPVNDWDPEKPISVLQFHRVSLKCLKLRRNNDLYPYDGLEFTQPFEKLTQLQLIGHVVKSLSFLRWMPKLEKLKLEQCPMGRIQYREGTVNNGIRLEEEADLVKNAENIMSNVVLLQMHSISFPVEFDVRSWKVLQNWMPNLRILKAIFNHFTFLAVTALWPQLKEIRCLDKSNLEDCSIVPKNDKTMREFYDGNVVGITALKDLEKFEQEPNYYVPGKLTDLSAAEGFLKLDKLTSLQICVASKNFSPKMAKKLKSKISQVRVIRKTSKEQPNYTFPLPST